MKTLESLKGVVETCVFCPKLCRYACPVAEAEARESVTPWGLMTHADNLRRSSENPGLESFELWSHCTGCGQCVSACKHDNPVPDTIMALRAMAHPVGTHPLTAWAEQKPTSSATMAQLPVAGAVVIVPGFASETRIEASLALLRACGYDDIARPTNDRTNSGWRLRAAGMAQAYEEARAALLEACPSPIIICLDVEDTVALTEALASSNTATDVRVLHLVEAVGALDSKSVRSPLERIALFSGCSGAAPGRDSTPLNSLLSAVIGGVVADAGLDLPGGGCCGRGAGYSELHAEPAGEMAQTVLSGRTEPVVAFGECAEHLRGAIQGRTVYEWTAFMAAALKGEEP